MGDPTFVLLISRAIALLTNTLSFRGAVICLSSLANGIGRVIFNLTVSMGLLYLLVRKTER